LESESERLLSEYARREREIPDDYYAVYHPANLFMRQGRERAALRALHYAETIPLTNRRVLEIGCGRGDWFSMFRDFGASNADLAGIDLIEQRVDEARRRFPEADIRRGDASRLPWPDASFDVVFQSTVFTSILDADARIAVAQEMLRVVKPAGVVLWYDFRYDNPRNPYVRGIGRREVRSLFPDRRIAFWRVTLAPPLARWIVPRCWRLAGLLESLTVLNTHLTAVIRPN
jgi:ubiquinone/menaquinone biosynthesis C-methylase UbiE